MMAAKNKYIVFYDSECILCNRTVRTLINFDKERKLAFAPIGGSTFMSIAPNITIENKNTIVFFNDGEILIRSTAVLGILNVLPYPLRLLGFFTIVPVFLRDAVYKFVARNRYSWFGKSQHCSWDNQKYSTIFLP